MARYKHIVFDIDGTMIDTQRAVLSGLRDTMKVIMDRDMTLDELIFSFGIPGEDALKQLGVPDTRAGLMEWNVHIRKYRSSVGPFPGIEETVSALKDVSVGVVTSKLRFEYDEEFLRFPELKSHMAIAVCADDTEKHKPEPEPLYKYMEITGARPEDILYVGDSIYDQMCAHSAGVDFALATWGATNKQIAAEWYPKTPDELIAIACDR